MKATEDIIKIQKSAILDTDNYIIPLIQAMKYRKEIAKRAIKCPTHEAKEHIAMLELSSNQIKKILGL